MIWWIKNNCFTLLIQGIIDYLCGGKKKIKMARILVACEESQAVCIAFRERGHEAYSCDILECSGGHPEWHIQGDVRNVLYREKWDLVIAHPPCTRLTNSGVCWLEKYDLWDELKEACDFFNIFTEYGKMGNKICIENPIPHKYARERIGDYTQIIQPWMFGHMERKSTCLWLFDLPKLKPTCDVRESMLKLPKNQQQRIHYLPPGPDRSKIRSKTYSGIAEAVAEQFTVYMETGKVVGELF
jgi:hypothetical protein